MSEGIRSVLLGTAGLGVAAAAAAVLAARRRGICGGRARIHACARVALVAVLLQAAHFAEELWTGFPERFPEILGLAPWPRGFFVPFNLLWLGIWLLAVWALAIRSWLALFPLWFLAIASAANGVAHPALALAVRGYFPGLLTAPLVGAAGLALLRDLSLLTGPPRASGWP